MIRRKIADQIAKALGRVHGSPESATSASDRANSSYLVLRCFTCDGPGPPPVGTQDLDIEAFSGVKKYSPWGPTPIKPAKVDPDG